MTSRKEIANDYRQMKSRLESSEGTKQDLDPSPDHVLLQEKQTVADSMTYTTSSIGVLAQGQYMETVTGQIGDNQVLKTLQSYREIGDGTVESLRSADLDGDGKAEFIETVRFDPKDPENNFIVLN